MTVRTLSVLLLNLCLCVGLIPAGYADAPPPGGMSGVSDAQLGEMRGRYVSGDQLLYFGLTLQTQWQTAAGATVTAGAGVLAAPGKAPAVYYGWDHAGASAGDVKGGEPASGGASNVVGVSQAIQISGDGNTVQNDISINIHQAAAMPGLPHDAAASSGDPGASARLASDGLSLRVSVAGQGDVVQQLKPGQGLQQSVRVTGDMNQVSNAVSLDIGLSGPLGQLPPQLLALPAIRAIQIRGGL